MKIGEKVAKKPTECMTVGEMLVKIGSTLGEISRYYAERIGLINPNANYPQLSKNTSLYINCKPYSVRRIRKDGEQDLVRLAHEIPYEGSWFYTPQDSRWYHISEDHTEEFGEHGKFRFSSIQRFGSLKISGKEIVHYHTHPKRAVEHVASWAGSELEKMERVDAKVIKDFLTATMYLYMAFPSDGDVEAYVDWSQSLQKQGVTFLGKIASPIGTTTIAIKDVSKDTVRGYDEIHRDMYRRMNEGKYVQFEERDGKPNIAIALEDMFDNINTEMQSRLHLTFKQVSCGIPLLG